MISAFRKIPRLLAVAALLSGFLVACDGSNAFRNPPVDPGDEDPDTDRPRVLMDLPKSDSTTIAVGDSVFVRFRAFDSTSPLETVKIEGFEIRGDSALGTATRVDRFLSKTIDFEDLGVITDDTTLTRYLTFIASDSTQSSRVIIVATAIDTAGNVGADSARIAVGGPSVTIAAPVQDAQVRAGTNLTVRVTAEDRVNQLTSVRVRTTGAFARDTTITLRVAQPTVDTSVVFLIPTAAQGRLTIDASVVSGNRQAGTARPVEISVLPPIADQTAPRVTFNATLPTRAESNDTLQVTVTAQDEVRVDSVGVTVLAIRRTAADEDTLTRIMRRVAATSNTFRISVADFRTAQFPLDGRDTLTLDFEVTAFAVDGARNCGAATTPGTEQSLPCLVRNAVTVSDGPGRLFPVLVARGLTIGFPNAGDRIADLIADSTRLFLSNLTRNRVEVIPLGTQAYGAPVRVGSEPWGLALGRNNDSLYVANSGGTNISVIPLRNATLAEAEGARIFTRNELLFDVDFTVDANTQTVTPTGVFRVDYSDRPQFIAQASNGLIVFSTKPTGAATDGTVRIYDRRDVARSEIFTGYVDRHTPNKALVVNADSAFLVPGEPNLLMVCPRRRVGDTTDPPCITAGVDDVSAALTAMRAAPPNASGGRWDTRVDIGADIDEVGFSDTTFVAVSTNRDYVAVGEGAATQARIPLFQASGDSLLLKGDVRDLINNANERVIGLGINGDGSLGIARGGQAYFFNNTLRLQGVTASGSPAGGVAMHPDNFSYPGGSGTRLAFVSGIDENGAPYIDIIDTFNFFRISRLFLRDPVVGAMTMARRVPSDPANVALRLYALTSRGVVGVVVTTTDLNP